MRRKRIVQKNDLILLLAVLLLCLAVSGAALLKRGASGEGSVVVTQDGNEIGRYPLSQDAEFVVEAPDGGSNTVVIRDGACYVSEADCPDGICVRRGRISRDRESIVCLPHRLVISVTGGKAGVDTIAQ